MNPFSQGSDDRSKSRSKQLASFADREGLNVRQNAPLLGALVVKGVAVFVRIAAKGRV
jgi:hypothetical protein